MASPSGYKKPHYARLLELIGQDSRELLGIVVYAFIGSILLLAIPLAAQGLVNVSAAGLSVQPLLVLSAALLIGLLFAGLLTCLRYYLAEIMMERILSRVALAVAEKLPKVKSHHLAQNGGPELMNRFFDVINIQKSWFKLVYDGPGAILEIILGLSLLALYGWQLFGVAAAFMIAGGLIVMIAGFGGTSSSIRESARKYRVAEWLEEMVRCQDSLRLNCRPGFWAEEADLRVVAYLKDRRSHFRVLMRQVVLHYFVIAIALSGMLGLGGYMVVTGKLSLGQLVAAELVVWSLFKATEKLLRACEAYFDLLTGLDKVGYITDMPTEQISVDHAFESGTSNSSMLKAEGLSYCHDGQAEPVFRDLSLEAQPGERITILGPTGVGKSTLLRLLGGFSQPQAGSVEIDLHDLRELSPEAKSETIGYMSERNEIFAGPVIDNLAVGRPCDLHRARELLMMTGGQAATRSARQGSFMALTSSGSTLSGGEQKSVLLSRALLGKPKLLLLDDCLGQLSEQTVGNLAREVFLREDRPTIISTATVPAIVMVSDRIVLLEKGGIVEQGAPAVLAGDPNSVFSTTYPSLANVLRTNPLPGSTNV